MVTGNQDSIVSEDIVTVKQDYDSIVSEDIVTVKQDYYSIVSDNIVTVKQDCDSILSENVVTVKQDHDPTLSDNIVTVKQDNDIIVSADIVTVKQDLDSTVSDNIVNVKQDNDSTVSEDIVTVKEDNYTIVSDNIITIKPDNYTIVSDNIVTVKQDNYTIVSDNILTVSQDDDSMISENIVTVNQDNESIVSENTVPVKQDYYPVEREHNSDVAEKIVIVNVTSERKDPDDCDNALYDTHVSTQQQDLPNIKNGSSHENRATFKKVKENKNVSCNVRTRTVSSKAASLNPVNAGQGNYPLREIVLILQEKPFSTWSDSDKRDLLAEGKPEPTMLQLRENKKRTMDSRKFRYEWYSSHDWLCGSQLKNALFCWWCLLVGSNNVTWCKDGFWGLNNATRCFKMHQLSKDHLRSALAIKYLEKSLNLSVDASKLKESMLKHENVKLNRRIVEILFKITLFLARQESAVSGHESLSPEPRGDFEQLLHEWVSLCKRDVQDQFQKLSSIFIKDSKTVHNDLIECVYEFLHSFVLEEIKEAKFFSIQVYDSTDIGQVGQCAVVVRFVNPQGRLVERLLGFVSADKTGEGFFHLLHGVLTPLEYRQRLVGQYYDGAIVMAEELHGLQNKIKEQAPAAAFVHCIAQQLNLVVDQILEQKSECRNFFSCFLSFPSFFPPRGKHIAVLNEVFGVEMPTVRTTRWSSKSELTNLVAKNYSKLKIAFERIIADDRTDIGTLKDARECLASMRSFGFAYLVLMFQKVYRVTNRLWLLLQKKYLNIDLCMMFNNFAQTELSELRDPKMQSELLKEARVLTGTSIATEELISHWKRISFDIIDTIKNQLKLRFKDLKYLKFLTLVDPGYYSAFAEEFPISRVKDFLIAYPPIFNEQQLKFQLEVFYVDSHFANLNIQQTILKMKEWDVSQFYYEVFALFCLAATLPSTSVQTESSFSCLTRLETAPRHFKSEVLAAIYIQKDAFDSIKSEDPLFFEKLIDLYAEKNCRIELKLNDKT